MVSLAGRGKERSFRPQDTEVVVHGFDRVGNGGLGSPVDRPTHKRRALAFNAVNSRRQVISRKATSSLCSNFLVTQATVFKLLAMCCTLSNGIHRWLIPTTDAAKDLYQAWVPLVGKPLLLFAPGCEERRAKRKNASTEDLVLPPCLLIHGRVSGLRGSRGCSRKR